LHLSQHKTPGKFELGQRIVPVESDPLKLELNSNPNAVEISRIAQASGLLLSLKIVAPNDGHPAPHASNS
jgi:hypothetical protein